MNRVELAQKLEHRNIDSTMYSLDGGLPNEAYCLGKDNDRWETYYSERGNKSELKVFASEEEACNYFYAWFLESLQSMRLMA